MKVLKYSIDPKAWSLALTCHWCDSQIEINADDLIYDGEPGDMKDAGWDSYTVGCGACGEVLEIQEKKLPNIIQSYAQKRKKKR